MTMINAYVPSVAWLVVCLSIGTVLQWLTTS
jgi:hypothetical protein